jgi:predicted dehydrogenase
MIDAAIVGLGRWGRTLVESVQGKSGGLRFTHAVSREPEKLQDYAGKHRLEVVGALDPVLADPRIDAVVLATPHSLHCEQIIAAAAAGKSVFCEKPLTLTKAEAARAIEACRAAGVVLGVGTDKRFYPSLRELVQLIKGGELGRVLHLEAHFSNEVAGTFTEWRYSLEESPAGGMTGTGIHALDTMIAMAGPVRRVQALLLSHKPPPTRSTASPCCSNSPRASAERLRQCARPRTICAYMPSAATPRPKRLAGTISCCGAAARSRKI